jgi:chaperone modulatory protein CbpM
MYSEDFIPAGEFCAVHQVELSFVRGLHESGLIRMITRDGSAFLTAGELPALERFVRWHYELAINSEGIEAISHLLTRVEMLQEENRLLQNRLRRFEGGESRPIQIAEEI